MMRIALLLKVTLNLIPGPGLFPKEKITMLSERASAGSMGEWVV
jgi:hypothetical protein